MMMGDPVALTIRAVDCGKYSEDRGSPACEQRSNTALGVLVVVGVLVLLVSVVVWRRLVRKAGAEQSPSGRGRSH